MGGRALEVEYRTPGRVEAGLHEVAGAALVPHHSDKSYQSGERYEVLAHLHEAAGAAMQHVIVDEQLARPPHLGFGRIVASDIEAPNMLGDLV